MDDVTERLYVLARELLDALEDTGVHTDPDRPARLREQVAEQISHSRTVLADIAVQLGPFPAGARATGRIRNGVDWSST
jgi:hypothetical protein